jgi:drug/metabolite transporter (DMT)-like permease
VAAVVAFNFGVRQLGASRGTLFLNGVPVSALLMSVALGQHPAMQEWIGAALVIAALTLSTRSPATVPTRKAEVKAGAMTGAVGRCPAT